MVIPDSMYTFEGRLGSFATARPLPKRRGSAAKVQKTASWPHATPSPAQLAKAGFFYAPTASYPDNVTCFMCHKSLDGWEEDDDPATEHLHHSKSCGWATIANVAWTVDGDNQDQEDPWSEDMKKARRATFANRWPHEEKKGWTCKIEKMVEGGWYYCPTPESDDFVACPYCELALDGWEPKDNPLEEHRRRSPHCPFVDRADTSAKLVKRTRLSKLSRVSKVSRTSRTSTQSEVTVLSEITPLEACTTEEEETSILTVGTETSMVSKAGKKTKKAKKPVAKPKSRKAKNRADDVIDGADVAEPENDDFEVKIELPRKPPVSGTKRKSSELEAGVSSNQQEQAEVDDALAPAPKRKGRVTRSRSSVIKQGGKDSKIPVESANQVADDTTADDDCLPIMPKKSLKKGGSKPRSSSNLGSKRNASASSASKASLRSKGADDDELDRALEADLDRSLADVMDVGPDTMVDEAPAITGYLARTRLVPDRPSTSCAPARTDSVESKDVKSAPGPQIPFAESMHVAAEVSTDSAVPLKKAKGRARTQGGKLASQKLVKSQRQEEPKDKAASLPVGKTTPSPSPQSSDAENHPPSSRRAALSPLKLTQTSRPLRTASTPFSSPSKRNVLPHHGIQTVMPWTAVDMEAVFLVSPGTLGHEDKENTREELLRDAIRGVKGRLTSPERAMSVEEWVQHNAQAGEERLRSECERLICVFEREGNRALQVLEGVMVAD